MDAAPLKKGGWKSIFRFHTFSTFSLVNLSTQLHCDNWGRGLGNRWVSGISLVYYSLCTALFWSYRPPLLHGENDPLSLFSTLWAVRAGFGIYEDTRLEPEPCWLTLYILHLETVNGWVKESQYVWKFIFGENGQNVQDLVDWGLSRNLLPVSQQAGPKT